MRMRTTYDAVDVPAVDPMSPIQERMNSWVASHPLASHRALKAAVREVVRGLRMAVLKQGSVRVDGSGVVLSGWSFDAKAWLKHEHGVVLGAAREGG